MVTSRVTLELLYYLWPLCFPVTSIWKERIEIGLLTPTNHTWGSSIAWSSNVKWPLFLVLAFPYGSCFSCLHSKGTKAEIDGAGITAEPKHGSLGFLFVCFHHLSANSGHLPSSGTCWVQQVQLYLSWPLSPLVSSCLIKPLLQTGPATSLLTAHLQPKLHIPLLGPPSSLTFQFTIFSYLGHGSVFLLDLWWVFLLLWVQASVYSGTAHVVQI